MLGPRQFKNFIDAVRDSTDPMAVRLIAESLDDGRSIDEILFTGEEFGFELDVKKIGNLRYRVAFGCLAGPLAGDGAEWVVAFDEGAQVVEIAIQTIWMA